MLLKNGYKPKFDEEDPNKCFICFKSLQHNKSHKLDFDGISQDEGSGIITPVFYHKICNSCLRINKEPLTEKHYEHGYYKKE